MAHSSESAIELDGLLLIPDFLSEAQEATLLERIDAVEWAQSQSGRRKQVGSRSENIVTVAFPGLRAAGQLQAQEGEDGQVHR